MNTSRVTYLGDLRTKNEHLASGSSFFTDAPTDNNGKGEAFSPTDTVATGLANCMFTMMGIKAKQLGVNLEGSYAEVLKTMASDPRRIAHIKVEFYLPASTESKNRQILEKTANTCPVHYSLHPEIEKEVRFNWL